MSAQSCIPRLFSPSPLLRVVWSPRPPQTFPIGPFSIRSVRWTRKRSAVMPGPSSPSLGQMTSPQSSSIVPAYRYPIFFFFNFPPCSAGNIPQSVPKPPFLPEGAIAGGFSSISAGFRRPPEGPRFFSPLFPEKRRAITTFPKFPSVVPFLESRRCFRLAHRNLLRQRSVLAPRGSLIRLALGLTSFQEGGPFTYTADSVARDPCPFG